MMGRIVRVIRFKPPKLNGITGWMLRTFCLRSNGPMLRLVLF